MRTILIMALFQIVILGINHSLHGFCANSMYYPEWPEELQLHFKAVQVFCSIGALFNGFIVAHILEKEDGGFSDHHQG